MNHSMRSKVPTVCCLWMLLCAMALVFPATGTSLAASRVLDPTVSPGMGGQQTILTISSMSAGFGSRRGVVMVGNKRCRVLFWSQKYIRARIVNEMDPGVYDVTIFGPARDPSVIFKGFKVVRQRIVSSGIIEVSPGSTYSVAAVNLPPKKGMAFMSVLGGPAINCTVQAWRPESVTIKIPKVAPGDYDLLLTTRKGNLSARSLFRVRADGDYWDYSWKDQGLTQTATGIMYGGKVCRFAPSRGGILYDISDKPESNGNQGIIREDLGVGAYTEDLAMPVVIGSRLYVFSTLHLNTIAYTWTEDVSVDQPRWAQSRFIKAEGLYVHDRPNVVYDAKDETVYIYYRARNGMIHVMASTDMVQWSNRILTFSEDNAPVSSDDSPSVTMNSKGEIMMARVVGDDIHVTKSKDPFTTSRNSRYTDSFFYDYDITSSPWIQNLGQGQVAITFYDGHHHTHIAIYTDDYDQWGDHVKYENSNSYRRTTLMPVFSTYIENPQDPIKGAEKMRIELWFFFWNDDNVYGYCNNNNIGELRRVEYQTQDWNILAGRLGYTGEGAAQVQEEITKACPLVGVVDTPPPCALNGNQTPSANKTVFTFEYKDEKSDTVQNTWKVGAFVNAGSSTFSTEIHAGLQGAFSKTTSTTSSIRYSFYPYYAAGKIAAIHAVPTTLARKFQAFRGGIKIESVPPIIVLQVLDHSLIPVKIDPPANDLMPRHTVGALRSYTPTVGGYEKTSNSEAWEWGQEPTIQLGVSTTVATTKGYYLSTKATGKIPKVVSFGLEGSFTWDTTHKTTTSNTWGLSLVNAEPVRTNDVERFQGTLLLLHATANPTPYWVPDYVKQGRDAAWFVTYYVNDIHYKK